MSAELPVVLTETVLSPEAAARTLGVSGRTVARWITDGCPVAGTLVVLEAAAVGGRWKTSREAVARFVAACDAARRPQSVSGPSPAQQRKQSRDDRRALLKMGVKL
jgi:hypothetical protein